MSSFITTMLVSPTSPLLSRPLPAILSAVQSCACRDLAAVSYANSSELESGLFQPQTIARANSKTCVTNSRCSNTRAKAQFKPKSINKASNGCQLRQFAEATLGSGSLRKIVKLPDGEDLNEWLAVNIVDFYNQINLLYGCVSEFCTTQTCPEMRATEEFEYLWQDSVNYKRPTKMPAPEYIEHLMAWIQTNIDDEVTFPSRSGVPFPKTFLPLVKQMYKRLYRVYAHMYSNHYAVITQLGLEPHMNTSYKHYVLFIDEHDLASGKDYWGPLGELVESMLKSD